jgi:exodeoxyribonuclease VII large subunit
MKPPFKSDATLEGILPQLPDSLEIILTVSSFASRIQRVLEEALPIAWIQGEISNFTEATSGHWYFNLKDANAQIRCVMFRSRNQRLDWRPRNGLAIELKGPTTFYPPNGSCQITVEAMRQAGVGKLFEAFSRLKEKLAGEGLFDDARKQPLPAHPVTIGIITSPAAAALRDVLSTLKRRSPATQIILYPTPVQGEGAAAQIAHTIDTAGRRAECDILILCRGGGSIEDLWAFNEEIVARALAACPIPVIAGIGHETDFTIADFVADRRAPTPTAAAEMVSPDRLGLLRQLATLGQRLGTLLQRRVERDGMRLDLVLRRLQSTARHTLQREELKLGRLRQRLVHPGERLRQQKSGLEGLRQRLSRAGKQHFERQRQTLQRLEAGLTHLNPQAVLSRGFSIVRDEAGTIIRDSHEIIAGQAIEIAFAQGKAQAKVTETES